MGIKSLKLERKKESILVINFTVGEKKKQRHIKLMLPFQ